MKMKCELYVWCARELNAPALLPITYNQDMPVPSTNIDTRRMEIIHTLCIANGSSKPRHTVNRVIISCPYSENRKEYVYIQFYDMKSQNMHILTKQKKKTKKRNNARAHIYKSYKLKHIDR